MTRDINEADKSAKRILILSDNGKKKTKIIKSLSILFVLRIN
tara:strand:+ start:332 stop:457 length:126 start_codon:yes stop_codon:yes gene_type:complete